MKIGVLWRRFRNVEQHMNLEPERTYDDAYLEALQYSYGLRDAGYETCLLEWRDECCETMREIEGEKVDLIFNASSTNEVAFCEILGLPYVGSDLGLVATDKAFRKAVVVYYGLTTPRFVVAKDEDSIPEIPFGYPVFIKPLSGRGSAGIGEDNIVRDPEAIREVVAKVVHGVGQPALIEEYIQGKEITVGVIGFRHPVALPAVEIEYNSQTTNTFEHKMFDRETIYCPARLPSVVEKDIRNTCLLIYEVLNAKDYARIDMMLDDHLEPYFLELNTFAGLTMESQVAEDKTMRLHHGYMGYAAKAAGMSQAELLGSIVKSSLDRYGMAG